MSISQSLSSSSRSSVSSKGRRYGEYGIPEKCTCGSPLQIDTCNTSADRGRRYYSCTNRSESGGTHLQRWVDDAVIEELADLKTGNCDRNARDRKLLLDLEAVREEIDVLKEQVGHFQIMQTQLEEVEEMKLQLRHLTIATRARNVRASQKNVYGVILMVIGVLLMAFVLPMVMVACLLN